MVNVRAIKSEADYRAALARVEVLWEAEEDTPESEELDVLTTLIEAFEDERYPTEAVSPIAAIRLRMDQDGLTNKDLVPLLGSTAKVSEVLSGKRPLTLSMIRALHDNLGISAEVLIREPGAQLPDAIEGVDWRRFPLPQMAQRGYISRLKDLKDHAEELMRELIERAGGMQNAAMARRRKNERRNSKMDSYALRAWCLQVLSIARHAERRKKYKAGTVDLLFLRKVARLSAREEGPAAAREFLAEHGIALVVLRHLPRTYLDGAAMLTPEGGPVVGMTLRHDRADNFWFCLLHELAHVGRHLDGDISTLFVDDLDLSAVDDAGSEAEADEWARVASIPEKEWQTLAGHDVSVHQVCMFAQRLGISPAIVAGRLRKERGNYRQFGELVGHGEVRKHFPEWQ